MASKTCDVCGKPSGMYPLCKECFKLKDEGKIKKCKDCGKWYLIEKGCDCKNDNIFFEPQDKDMKGNTIINENKSNRNIKKTKISKDKCIICGKTTDNSIQCKNCKEQTIAFQDELNKNAMPFELKDYYYNLKSKIYRMYDFETVKVNCNKLIAISNLLLMLYNDSSLAERVTNDIKDIIIAKDPKEIEQIITEYTRKTDEEKQYIIRTNDGHCVKSDAEKQIDDIIYSLGYAHSYGKRVTEIPRTERAVECDWYIPIIQNKGIYIEYWGMEIKSYLENKEEKKVLYKKYNVPLIEIEKDDIKHDSQGLHDRIITEIKELRDKILKSL